jgi:hypothetical protein
MEHLVALGSLLQVILLSLQIFQLSRNVIAEHKPTHKKKSKLWGRISRLAHARR